MIKAHRNVVRNLKIPIMWKYTFFSFVGTLLFESNCFLLGTRKYYTSHDPGSDLKLISHAQASLISNHWYKKITNESTNANQQGHILKHVETLKSYIKSTKREKYSYFAWMPSESNTTEKANLVMSIVVCEKESLKLDLMCIVPNPSWSSQNIESKELKRCIFGLERDGIIINITNFCNHQNNIRYKLDWFI